LCPACRWLKVLIICYLLQSYEIHCWLKVQCSAGDCWMHIGLLIQTKGSTLIVSSCNYHINLTEILQVKAIISCVLHLPVRVVLPARAGLWNSVHCWLKVQLQWLLNAHWLIQR
jgi:hypothetical protein